MNRKSLASAFGLLLAFTVAGSTGYAQQTKTLSQGVTSVTLSNTFVNALASLNVTAGTVAPTELENGAASFPVIGGALDLATAKGNILHSGGLTLNAGDTHVALQSFIIDTTATPIITGLVTVNGALVGRLPLFDIMLPSGFSVPLNPRGWVLQLKGIGLTLDPTAARALSGVFKTTVPGGLPIGTANVTLFLHNHDWQQSSYSDWGSDR